MQTWSLFHPLQMGRHGVVESGSVKSSSLHVPLPLLFRVNVAPFLVAYAAFAVGYLFHYDEYEVYLLFGLPLLAFVHAISLLSCFWSVHARTILTCRSVSAVGEGVFVKIVPTSNKGASDFVPVEIRDEDRAFYISWRKRQFLWNKEQQLFTKTRYPINLTFSDYLSAGGYQTEEEQKEAELRWGTNKFDIPMPQFLDLYKEQAVAPFFIFQMFCVLLWCLDEYWYYSILTLVMLLVFEGTIVASRLRNLKSLRNMIQPPYPVMVYRGKGKWEETSSYNLMPGDICSVVRQQADTLLPCDLLLLNGSCVVNEAMLTGESTPQLKESIQQRENDNLNIQKDRLHVLFGGTNVINHTSGSDLANVGKPPNGGAIAYVLRTGFETNQGKLIRTILFSTDRVTANSVESLLFILFLLIFAVAASGYVLVHGWNDPEKSRYKLIVECSLIITSVVPPELPMELSLAVNTSLVALSKLGVFCTEPFRIPFCGKTEICCFDKTGTLTTDKLILRGISIPSDEKSDQQPEETLIDPSAATDWIHFAVAGCNSLMFVDKELVGDPMEVAALQAMHWEPTKNDVVTRTSGPSQKIRILHRFHFESALKRMCTIASTESNNPTYFATMKGAPEMVATFLTQVPSTYESTYKYFSRQGYRVIAVAYRSFKNARSSVSRMSREEIETDMTFCGFLIFECPIKPDSAATIKALTESSHQTVMITGDNILTACKVSEILGMLEKPALLLEEPEGDQDPVWVSVDESITFPVAKLDVGKDYDLCVSGKTLPFLVEKKMLSSFLPSIKVYARVSPEQKEIIILAIKDSGKIVLMCGDGTNDVGALKQAHVGVALLNTAGGQKDSKPDTQQISIKSTSDRKDLRNRQQKKTKGPSKKENTPPTMDSLTSSRPAPQRRRPPPKKPQIGPPTIFDDEEMASIKLGDASIASPFTAKGSSVAPIIDIIRQGRCTLVTTLQMFMILALNCLISAYSMSVLYYEGFKMGDTQATVMGMLIAMCFLFISRSKPLDKLSKQRPASSIFTIKFFTSLLGQFAIHLSALMYVHKVAMEADTVPIDEDLEAPFKPTLINSAVFLISNTMHVSTFAVNYRGHPFMQSLWENKPLLYCVAGVGTLTALAAAQVSPGITEMLELVPFDDEFRNLLLSIMAADFVGAFVWDRLMSLLFGR